MRTCIVTKKSFPKENLIRVALSKDGNVKIDLTGKAPGRGAYLKATIEVIKTAKLKKILEKKFLISVPDEIYKELEKFVNA